MMLKSSQNGAKTEPVGAKIEKKGKLSCNWQQDRCWRRFREPFWMHFGGLEGAKGRPMGAKRPPKSRKIASKFDVDFGMHFGTPKKEKMEAKGRPREPK